MPFPDIDPVAFTILGLPIRWYSLAYMGGLFLGYIYILRMVANASMWAGGRAPASKEDVDDMFLWVTLGVILGGRIGYVLFYNPLYFLRHPQEILQVWSGGMSFHGGLLGVTLALLVFTRRRNISPLSVADLVAACVTIGIFFGRIANFINGELWGRVTTHAWGVVFPNGGALPRHPSQLYEAALEGLLLFIISQILIFRYRALHRPGLVAGVFLIGYGVARIIVENFRAPDAHIGFIGGGLTMGILLSVPLILLGIGFIRHALGARHG